MPCEPLAVTKVVGTVLRHTVGYQNQFGGRRSDAPLSYSYIQRYANLGGRANLSRALRHALASNYIRRVEEGSVAASAADRRPAAYAVKWLDSAENPPGGSKTEPAASEWFKNGTSDGSEPVPAERFKNGTKENTAGNDNSKQQHAPAAVAAENVKGYELLRATGFDEKIAAQLAEGRGGEEIERQIAWLPKRNPSRNRLGLLRRAIEENWAKPTAVKRVEHNETTHRREVEEETQQARNEADRRRHHEQMSRTWSALTDDERSRVVDRALQNIESAFVRNRITACRKRGVLNEPPLDVLLHLEPYFPTAEKRAD